MRTQKTIRKELEKRRASPYRQYNCIEIGALLWVLGEADSLRDGMRAEKEAALKARIKVTP